MTFSLDFYLIKFVEDGVRRVLSRDKIKIQEEQDCHVKHIGKIHRPKAGFQL